MERIVSVTLFCGMKPLKLTMQCSSGTEIDVYSCLDLTTGE